MGVHWPARHARVRRVPRLVRTILWSTALATIVAAAPGIAAAAAVRINSGGPTQTASGGTTFGADAYFSGGEAAAVTQPVSGTSDPALYQTERWGSWSYAVPVSDGTYTVKLHFAETYYRAPCAGDRVFSVDVADTPVAPDLVNLDTCAAVGPDAALVRTISNVAVEDGTVNVRGIYGSADDPSISAVEVIPVPPAAVRINAGGPAYTSSSGAIFSADAFFSGGQSASVTKPISGTNDPALYQDERWGDWSYTIPVVAGLYDLKLHFAETFYGAPCGGRRVFGVDVAETTASPDVANLDICAAVGADTALVRTISGVDVTGTAVTIQSLYGSADDPAITAIEVLPASAPPADTQPPSTPTNLRTTGATQTSVSLAWNASTDNVGVSGYGVYRNGASVATTTSTSSTVSGLACGTTYTFAVDAYDAAGNRSAKASLSAATSACPPAATAKRVNAGGPAFTAAGGLVFAADTYFTGGTAAASVTRPIAGTTDDALYQSERWGNWSYAVPVENGTYTVKLHFAETYFTAPCAGDRVFSVDIADTAPNPDLPGLDVCAAVGPDAALVRTIANVNVTDGVVNVRGIAGAADAPEINAIELIPGTTSGDTQAPSTPGLLRTTGATQTSVSLAWDASTDNVGVSGYGVYRNGAGVATTTTTSSTVSGLACGTTYTFAVDAYDTAGNRSAKVSLSAATTACSASSGDVFLSPSGSDSNPCTQTAPCRTFDRAYRVASPGDVVQLAGGSYGSQSIEIDGSKTSTTDVIFRPAAGATVTAGTIDVDGSHVEFRDLKLTGWNTYPTADDVTFRNITANMHYIVGSSNVNVLGGSYGPVTDQDNTQIKPYCFGCQGPLHILIDGVSYHDARLSPGSDAHVECMQVWHTRYLTVRNSKFHNCESHHIFFAGEGEPIRDVTFENNMGGTVLGGFYSFRIASNTPGEGCVNVVFRNNSATTPMSIECSTASNVRLIANVGNLGQSRCDSRYDWRFNVWNGAKCGSTDVNAPSGYLNPGAGDLHLAPGSAAIDRGDPSSFPAVDIDGNARPMGGAPDAGADEAQ